MSDADPRDQISQLEARIEDLAEIIARCRKVDLAARIAMAAGALWMLVMAFGLVAADATALMAAMTAVIGGIVVFGSNASTSRQMSAALAEAEASRAELIGGLRLRIVHGAAVAPER